MNSLHRSLKKGRLVGVQAGFRVEGLRSLRLTLRVSRAQGFKS